MALLKENKDKDSVSAQLESGQLRFARQLASYLSEAQSSPGKQVCFTGNEQAHMHKRRQRRLSVDIIRATPVSPRGEHKQFTKYTTKAAAYKPLP